MDKLLPWILISALLKKFQYKFSRQNNPIGIYLPRKANLKFKERIWPIYKAQCVHMYMYVSTIYKLSSWLCLDQLFHFH